jgi:hypothetical protein
MRQDLKFYSILISCKKLEVRHNVTFELVAVHLLEHVCTHLEYLVITFSASLDAQVTKKRYHRMHVGSMFHRVEAA